MIVFYLSFIDQHNYLSRIWFGTRIIEYLKKTLIYLQFSFQEHGIDYLESFRRCEFNISRQFYYCEQQTLEIFKHTALYRYLGMSIFRF